MSERGLWARLAEQRDRLISVEVFGGEEARLRRLFDILMLVSTGIVSGIALAFVAVWALGLTPPSTALVGSLFPLAFIPISLFCMALARRRSVRSVASLYVILNFVGIALAVLLFDGPLSPGWILYIWTVSVAGILLAPVYALWLTGIVVVYFLFLLLLSGMGIYTPPFTLTIEGREFMYVTMTMIILVSTVGFLTYLSMRSLGEAMERLRATTQELEEHRRTLEQRVADRTAALVHRTEQLENAAQVARDVVAVRDVQELLERAVSLISDRLGFHHTAIFLVDETGDYAVLRAASSEEGRRLLDQGYHLRVGGETVVGYVTGTGLVRTVRANEMEETLPAPHARSRVVLPLRVGDRIIGALDILSEEEEAFQEADVAMLRLLADQLAVAIENARLLDEMERAVRELERAYGEYTWETWRDASHYAPLQGMRYHRQRLEPTDELSEEARQALKEGKPVIRPLRQEGGGGEGGVSLAIPMRLRDQVIGALSVRFTTEEVPSEVVQMMEEVGNRIALALENARLLEETRRRAAWERTLSAVTARIRAEAEIDAILERALEELSRTLGAERAFVQLSADVGAPTTRRGGRRAAQEVGG